MGKRSRDKGASIAFTIPGEPKPWRAPKVVRRGNFHAAVSPQAMKDAQANARMFAAQAMGDAPPLTGPVEVTIRAYRAKGMKSLSKKRQRMAEAGEIRPTTRPDASNIGKLCEDALTGVCYVDDSQVVRLVVEKWYSSAPRCEVEVRALD